MGFACECVWSLVGGEGTLDVRVWSFDFGVWVGFAAHGVFSLWGPALLLLLSVLSWRGGGNNNFHLHV